MTAKTTKSTVIAAMKYRDAAAAIDWLVGAFGFEKHLVVPGEGGAIAHAELVFGDGMVMLGSSREGDYDRLLAPLAETGGKPTLGLYVVVDDVDAHYARAKAAGAEILIDIKDEDYGGRDYTCRDPEGYVWTFGSYDPWTGG